MLSFPSDWANLVQTLSPGQSSCSNSALQAAIMSWEYIIPISSYKYHMESCNCLQTPWKRWSLTCFWTLLMFNIIGYSCWTTFSAPSNWVTYTVHTLSSLVVIYKNFILKYLRMQRCHIQVLIYLLSLTLGLVDLDIKPGHPWLCVRTILFPPSVLPLCDFASHFSLQMPISQMRPPPSGWSSPLNVLNFWHFTHYLRGHTGDSKYHIVALVFA